MKVVKSDTPEKRFVAIFTNGKRVKFGQPGANTYLDGASEQTRKNYIARHRVNENWSDPYSPGALARYILWEHRSLSVAVRDYNRRFLNRDLT